MKGGDVRVGPFVVPETGDGVPIRLDYVSKRFRKFTVLDECFFPETGE